MTLDKNDYVVGMAVTPKDDGKNGKAGDAKANGKAKADAKAAKKKAAAEPEATVGAAEMAGEAAHARLILSVTEMGYGKRTHVDEYRLQSRGGKGVINVKTTARNGNVSAILLVDEHSEAMIISQFGKIIRIDTTQIREAGRSTQGVRLLHMEGGDKVAAAVVIPKEEADANGNGTPPLIQ
jgi:DNA gyrase subunit A